MKISISIYDELTNKVIQSNGLLDLDSGEVTDVKYINYNVDKEGFPSLKKNYEFTCAIITKNDKEMEFTLNVNAGDYCVSADELEELKQKSIKLFSTKSSVKKRV